MAGPTEELNGGCQCGAVRYAASDPFGPHYCHCRMCQRASGNAFAAFVGFHADRFRFTRGAAKLYRSSSFAVRGFCADCGTPLTFQYDREPHRIGLSIGSLDHPERVAPAIHWGVESMLPWLRFDDGLPRKRTEDDPSFLAAKTGG